MDDADWITPEVALGKAWTAAAFRAPSDAQGQKAKDLVAFAGSISAATHGRYTPQIGGLPLVIDGTAAGGMGASGGTGPEDEAVGRAAMERVVGGSGSRTATRKASQDRSGAGAGGRGGRERVVGGSSSRTAT